MTLTVGQKRASSGLDEEQLRTWTRRAYRDEDRRAEQIERSVRQAMSSHPLLRDLDLAVYSKGSYKNNTNVRRDSDIDVAVEYRGILFTGCAPSVHEADVWAARGLSIYQGPLLDHFGAFDSEAFKVAIGEALISVFGPQVVDRSNKVFTVAASSGSVAADVVPCVSYDYHYSPSHWVDGVALLPDRPQRHPLVNFPRQHYRCGLIDRTPFIGPPRVRVRG